MMATHTDADDQTDPQHTTAFVGRVRIAIGLVQGICAWLLLKLAEMAGENYSNIDGQLKPHASAKFDYQFLRFGSGSFGTAALEQLTHDSNADVQARALRAQKIKDRYFFNNEIDPEATEAAFSHVTLYPSGVQLPDDFRNQSWKLDANTFEHNCLIDGTPCNIYQIHYGVKGNTALIIQSTERNSVDEAATPEQPTGHETNRGLVLYERKSGGGWLRTGSLSLPDCKNMTALLKTGQIASVRPQHDDLSLGGVRVEMNADATPDDVSACPKVVAKEPSASLKSDATAPRQMGPAFGHPGGL